MIIHLYDIKICRIYIARFHIKSCNGSKKKLIDGDKT